MDFVVVDFEQNVIIFSDRWIITAAHCCGSELKETAPGVITPLDQVQITFGEHTVFQGGNVVESLKKDRFLLSQKNAIESFAIHELVYVSSRAQI